MILEGQSAVNGILQNTVFYLAVIQAGDFPILTRRGPVPMSKSGFPPICLTAIDRSGMVLLTMPLAGRAWGCAAGQGT